MSTMRLAAYAGVNSFIKRLRKEAESAGSYFYILPYLRQYVKVLLAARGLVLAECTNWTFLTQLSTRQRIQ